MTKRTKGISDVALFKEENRAFLREIKTEVCKKVDDLEKLVNKFEKLHKTKFLVLVEHLHKTDERPDLFEYQVLKWFTMLLFLLDKSQLIQTGKLIYKYQSDQMESVDQICSTRKGDFVWGDTQQKKSLNNMSYQAHKYYFEDFCSLLKKEDVASEVLELDNDAVWSNTYLRLLDIDTRLKDFGKSLELVGGAKIVCVVNLLYSKESLEIHYARNRETFKRKEYFIEKMTAEACSVLMSAISELRLVEMAGEERFCVDFFEHHAAAAEQDAQETAVALAVLKRVADERTAEDAVLQEEKRRQTIIDRERADKAYKKKAKEREQAKVFRKYEKDLAKLKQMLSPPTNAVVVPPLLPTTNSETGHNSAKSPRKRRTTSKPQQSIIQRAKVTVSADEDELVEAEEIQQALEQSMDDDDDDEEDARRPFFVPDGPVPMRRNKEGQQEEDTSDEEDDNDETGTKRRKRQRVFEAPFMNSELHKYLMESGRRKLQESMQPRDEADVSGEGAVDRAIAALQDNLIDPVSESALKMDVHGRKILHLVYDKLNFKDVISTTSPMSTSERNRAVDLAYCEVVVQDVCDTVMKNSYRDQNSAVYWYLKRTVNNLVGDEVAVIEKHQWQLFWIEVKEKAMERLLIKPKLLQRPDIGGKPSAPQRIPLTESEKRKNELRSRSCNTAISYLAKKVVYVYETLSGGIRSMNISLFEGCGFILPNGSNMEEVFNSIEIDKDNVLQLIAGKEFDPTDYEDFKEVIMSKENRNDFKTALEIHQKKKREAQLRKQIEGSFKTTDAEGSFLPVESTTGPEGSHLAVGSTTTSYLAGGSTRNQPALVEIDSNEMSTIGRDGLSNSSFGSSFLNASFDREDSSPPSSPRMDQVVSPKIPRYIPVNYAIISATAKSVFQGSKGYWNGMYIEHNKLKTAAYSNQRYVNDLVHIIALIGKFKKSDGFFRDDEFPAILEACKADDVVQRMVFVVRKTFDVPVVEYACANNTRADGYCMWWMTLQQELRSNDATIDCANLRDRNASMSVDTHLVPHIQHYIDRVKYKEKESQEMAMVQLTTVLGRAREFPHLPNPFNLWGNSKLCRFIDTRLMIFCLESAEERVDAAGMHQKVAQLCIVNHALGDMYQDGAPQFTLDQMKHMFSAPMYAAFMQSHFFSLENPSGEEEVACMEDAYSDWVHLITERIETMSVNQLAAINAMNSNNKYHADCIDMSMEDDECDDTRGNECDEGGNDEIGRFTGEVSFHGNVPFRDDQRDSMYKTILLMKQRIAEMECEMKKLKISCN